MMVTATGSLFRLLKVAIIDFDDIEVDRNRRFERKKGATEMLFILQRR